MSTKPIREALALVREDKHPEALRKALESVEAIETAAKEWVRVGGDFNMDEEEAFNALMESIAEEAQ